MKKRELIEAVAGHIGVDKKAATAAVEGTIDVILATVASGEIVNLSGFAKFEKRKRPARMVRNPQTGAMSKSPAKTVAKITALKGFKDIALGVAAAPKLIKAAPVVKKAAVKKAAVAKKAPAKKAVAKKAPAKKAARR
jgi:DNA-binding protein HU-beta